MSPDGQVPEGHGVVHEVAWEEGGQDGSVRATIHSQEAPGLLTCALCQVMSGVTGPGLVSEKVSPGGCNLMPGMWLDPPVLLYSE